MASSTHSPVLERDLVCGMNVNPATAKHVHEHSGKKYYFCCGSCAEKFKADAEKYSNKPAAASSGLVTLGMPAAKPAGMPPPQTAHDHPHSAQPTGEGTPAYVCPMCPEVRESKPVPCPSCGMALEPETSVVATRVEYTCPMHPEIVRPGPGSCPIAA